MKLHALLLCFLTLPAMMQAQVVLERDINQEPAPSDPSFFAELDNILYFRADDGINGEELYQFDLDTETASLVANIREYEEGSNISEVVAFNGKIYFNPRATGIDNYLYVYDPSDESVQRLMDSNGQDVKEPTNMTVFDGQLFFGYEADNNDFELGRYDPAENLIEYFPEINENGNAFPNFFTAANGYLWFTAIDGQSDSRLWRYDPSTGMVENILYDSPDELYPSMSFLYFFEGKLFFQGYSQSTGEELWIYNPTTNTLEDVVEIYPGIASSSPSGFTAFEGKLYFSARTIDTGRELRVYDPANGEISLVADLYLDGNANPGAIFPINDALYFTASVDDIERKLFSYSTANGISEEATLDNGDGPNFLTTQIVADGKLFLTGLQIETARELFSFTPGSSTIELAADINTTTVGSAPYGFTAYNGKLYFGADEVNSGREVWVYDPTTGMVEILSDLPGSTAPNGFTELAGKLFFSGVHPEEGYGLLYYDDNSGAIAPTSFITPNNTGHITDITAYDGLLYFKAFDENVGTELFVYDPATDLFSIAADIHPDGDGNPENLFVFDNQLYFEANNGVSGTELWRYNSTTQQASQVADINPGEASSSPGWFTVYNGELYFSAIAQDFGYDVYSYNPDIEEVTQRTDVSGNLNPQHLVVYHDKLFFNGRYSASVNAELVYYDAATDELTLTEDLNPSASNPRYLTVFNDKLYFATFTDEYGRELWEYNDTTLSIVADIRSGVPSSDPQNLTLFNDKLYFAANDGMRGAELWSIAECLNIIVDTEPQIGPDGFGAIDLSIQGGLPPYTINWNTGATTEDLEGLEPGIYTATVTDASGCLSEVIAEVVFVSSTRELLSPDQVRLFPNPNPGYFSSWNLIQAIGKIESVSVMDSKGQLIYHRSIDSPRSRIDLALEYAPPGVYIVKILADEGELSKQSSHQIA